MPVTQQWLLTIQLIPRAWAEGQDFDAALLYCDGELDAGRAWADYIPPFDYRAIIGATYASAEARGIDMQCWRGADIELQVWTHRASIEAFSVRLGRAADLARLAALAQRLQLVVVNPPHRAIVDVAALTVAA